MIINFFKRKYVKIPIVTLIIFSMLFQFIPARQPAQASVLEWLQKTLSKISIPEIGIKENGSFKIGGLFCISGDEPGCLLPCMKRDGECECIPIEEEPIPPEPINLNAILATATDIYEEELPFFDDQNCEYILYKDPDAEGGSYNEGACLEYEDDEPHPTCEKCKRLETCINTLDQAMATGYLNYPRIEGACVDLNISISDTGDVSSTEKPDCVEVCDGPCVNPFSLMSLGDTSSQVDLVDEEGNLKMPRLSFPPQCELRVPMPEDDDKMSEEQKLAQRKACTYFTRLQQGAAQQIFLAKKMFNSTDPFTECFFLRNCRSDCGIRLGEFKFTITIIDIANMFLPTGFITVIQKILNIAKIISQFVRIWVQVKDLLSNGLEIVNNIIGVINQVHSFFVAFTSAGLKMSDALIYGAGAVASSYAGGQLQEIGVGKGGKVGWLIEQGGDLLVEGDGLIGGAAATAVLNSDRAKRGWEGMKDLLLSFAENNRKFGQAKGEAITFLMKIEGDVETIKSHFKIENEIRFLFAETDESRRLDKIFDDYFLVFESIDAFLAEMVQAGQLSNGDTVLSMKTGEYEIGEMVQVDDKDDDYREWRPASISSYKVNDYDYSDPKNIELIFDDENETILRVVYEPYGIDSMVNQCKFERPVVSVISKCIVMNPSNASPMGTVYADYSDGEKILMDVLWDLPDYYGNTAIDYSPSAFFSTPRGCDWFDNLSDIYKNVNAVKILLDDGTYVKEVIEKALSGCGKNKCGENCYDCSDLDSSKSAWVGYWRTVAGALGIPITTQVTVGGETFEAYIKHSAIMDRVIVEIEAFDVLRDLEIWTTGKGKLNLNHNMADNGWLNSASAKADGPKGWVDVNKIQVFIDRRDANYLETINSLIGNTLDSVGANTKKLWWQKASLTAEYQYILEKQGDLYNRLRSPYWHEVAWNSPADSRPTCQVGDVLSMDLIKQTHFDPFYDSDVMYQNWDDKIGRLVKASKGLPVLSQALLWEVSPNAPLMVYTIEKARRSIKELSATASADIDDETRAILEAAIDEAIEALKIKTDFPQSKSDYDNYTNCGACQVDKSGTDNVAASNVNDTACCGKELTITADSFDATDEKCLLGTAGAIPDGLDNMACKDLFDETGNGYFKAIDCKNIYAGGGTGSCSNSISTYVPVSWITSYATCSNCKTNCVSNCSRPCQDNSYWEYDCTDIANGDVWGPHNGKCGVSDACYDEDDLHPEDCDDWYVSQHLCPLNGNTYSNSNTCQTVCTRPNCGSASACESAYCSNTPNDTGVGGGPCYWEDYYKKQQDSFDGLSAKYKPGFMKYEYYERQTQLLERIRLGLDDLLNTSGDLVMALEAEFDSLTDEFLRLQREWKKVPKVKRESGAASSYIDRIVNSIDISISIVGADGAGGIVGEIQRLLNDIITLKDGMAGLIVTSGLDEEIKTSLNDGLIRKLNKFVAIIKMEIILPMQARLGVYDADCLPAGNTCTLEEGVCTQDDGVCSLAELECPRKNGFLNRIACFEEDNDRTFNDLFDFMDVLENLESIAIALPMIGESIEDIKPEWRMEPPKIKPNLLDIFEKKAIACGKSISATDEENRDAAKCNEKVMIFEGQLPEDSTWETFQAGLLDDPLSAINRHFNNILSKIENYIEKPIERAGFNELPNDYGVEKDNVFGSAGDRERFDMYQTALGGVQEEISTLWFDFIWGADEKLRNACNTLAPILDNHPAAVEEDCKYMDESSRESFLGDTELENKCKALDRLPPDLFEELQKNPGYIMDEVEKMADERMCVGGAVRCNDGTRPCVQCPKWFCRSADDPYSWGVNDGDPVCYEDIDGDGVLEEKPGVKSGIIWDASVSTTNVKDHVCTGAMLGADCEIDDLELMCSRFKKEVSMYEFDNVSEMQANIIRIGEIESEMACVTYEECGDDYGSADVIANHTIEKTPTGKPCISCPRWICENLDNDLTTVDDPNCAADSLTALSGTLDASVNGNVGSGSPQLKYTGIVWSDVSASTGEWPRSVTGGLKKWPRPTACLTDDAGTLPALSSLADDNHMSQALATERCIERQIEYKELKTVTPDVVVLPWDDDGWPCTSREECGALEASCAELDNGTAVEVVSGWSEWPPDDPCDGNRYVSNYLGRQSRCLTTQQTMIDLEAMQEFLEELGDTSQLPQLADKCAVLGYQQEIKKECDNFYTLKQAFNCSGGGCDDPPYTEAKEVNKRLQELCKTDVTISEFECDASKHPRRDMTFNELSVFGGSEEDKLSEISKSSGARARAKRLCSETFYDMRTPLNEVMKVFSVLIGIKSYTGAKKSSGELVNIDFKALRNKDWKSLVGADIKNLYAQAQQVIAMIQGIPDMIGSKWGEVDVGTGGSIQLSPPKCIARPMVSYTSNGVRVTGPDGGPVCPDLSNTFAQLDAKFSLIRNDLRQIDLVRRDHTVELSIGKLGIGIEGQPINRKLNEYVGPLYNDAKEIKDKAQFLWALATAVNFANKNCTCGKSWCPQIGKIPFCVSGIPLTITPLKKPECSLVWLLRYPLGSLAASMEEQLQEQYKDK